MTASVTFCDRLIKSVRKYKLKRDGFRHKRKGAVMDIKEIDLKSLKTLINSQKEDFFISVDLTALLQQNVTESVTIHEERGGEYGRD